MPTQSQPAEKARASSGPLQSSEYLQQAGMSTWPKLPGVIIQRFFTFLFLDGGVTFPLKNPIQKALLLPLEKSCPQSRGFLCLCSTHKPQGGIPIYLFSCTRS